MDVKFTESAPESLLVNKQQLIDHDIIIEIRSDQKNFIQKFEAFQMEVITRIVKLETWKETEDIYHAKIPLMEYDSNSKWVTKVRNNWHFIVMAIAALGVIVNTIVGNIIIKWINSK